MVSSEIAALTLKVEESSTKGRRVEFGCIGYVAAIGEELIGVVLTVRAMAVVAMALVAPRVEAVAVAMDDDDLHGGLRSAGQLLIANQLTPAQLIERASGPRTSSRILTFGDAEGSEEKDKEKRKPAGGGRKAVDVDALMLNAAASANLKTIPLRDQPLDACVEALHRGVLARPPSVPALDASSLEVGTKATGRATIRRDRHGHGDYEDGTPNRGTLCSEFEHAGLALAVAYSFRRRRRRCRARVLRRLRAGL